MKIFVSLSRMWDLQDPEIEQALDKAGIVLGESGSFAASDEAENARIDLFFKLLKSVNYRRIKPQNTGPNDYYYVKSGTTVRMTTQNDKGFSTIYSITVG